MSAVIVSITPSLEAGNLTARRALALGYGPMAVNQFVRMAAKLVAHGMDPIIAAHRAVMPKDKHNGDVPLERA